MYVYIYIHTFYTCNIHVQKISEFLKFRTCKKKKKPQELQAKGTTYAKAQPREKCPVFWK